MKYLLFLCLFLVQNMFGQSIDCALLTKINGAQVNKKTTRRSQTTMVMNFGTIESTSEVDTAKNMRILMTLPAIGGLPKRNSESRIIKGINYSKNAGDSAWYYRTMPPQDSAKTIEDLKTFEVGQQCTIVGTETINGKLLTIIESSGLIEKISDKPIVLRTWYDLKDSVVKKTFVNLVTKDGAQMKIQADYGVDIAPIEKPLNALPDSSKPNNASPKRIKGAYAEKNQGNTDKNNEKTAGYKDGQRALFDFINKNLVYPQAAKDAKLEGTVYVKFVVETDGTITEMKVARGIGSGCDEAALELVKKMSGKWICASDGGQPVRSQFTLPIKFRL